MTNKKAGGRLVKFLFIPFFFLIIIGSIFLSIYLQHTPKIIWEQKADVIFNKNYQVNNIIVSGVIENNAITINAWDTKSGKNKWTKLLHDPIWWKSYVIDNRGYFLTKNNGLFILDINSGKEVSNVLQIHDLIANSNNSLYAVTREGENCFIQAIAIDGSLLTKKVINCNDVFTSPSLKNQQLILDETKYERYLDKPCLLCFDSRVYFLRATDKFTNNIKWIWGGRIESPLFTDSMYIFFLSRDTLYAVR